jgi:plasmid stability protein
MAQLLVRGLEQETKTRLQARAARHGQSMEAEARDILRDAVKDEGRPAEVGLGTRIAARFAGIGLEPGELKRIEWSEPRNPFEE